MSETRTHLAMAFPTARSTLSPTTWPNWSLMGLKPSRSSMAKASGSPWRSVARKSNASAPVAASTTVMPASEKRARWNSLSASSACTTRMRDGSDMTAPRNRVVLARWRRRAPASAEDHFAHAAIGEERRGALALVALQDDRVALDCAAAAEGVLEVLEPDLEVRRLEIELL